MKKITLKKIIDYVLVFLLFILSIKKGGFYKSDTIFFNLGVNILAIFSIILNNLKYINNKKRIFDIGNILLLFSTAYILPVLLRNCTSLNDSIFEFIRYYNMYLIYIIVSNSDNKKIYINGIIAISVVLVIFGIDQMGCRYMSDILSKVNSGYLDSNIDRMSSTIQYANVFAIICLVAYILVLDKLKNIKENKKTLYLYNILQFVMLIGIFLSMSRTVIILGIVVLTYYLLKYRDIEINKNIVLNLIYSLIFLLSSEKILSVNLKLFYIVSIAFVIINAFLTFIILKINLSKIVNKKILKNKFILVIICVFIIIYLVIALNVQPDIYLSSKSMPPYITRNIYSCINEGENNLTIKVDELEEDSRYEIYICQVADESNYKVVDKLQYYSSTNGEFNVSFESIENIKYVNINVDCAKGSLKITDIILNGKSFKKNYLLLPTNILNRFIDGIYSSNSINYRFEYQKDALKITTSNIKNIIFGIGGEGFYNMYRYYKTTDYNSTEVHNIYLQMLLESGIIGLVLFILLIYLIIKKYKFDAVKISVITILIHGVFDLDFSYMIILAIFAILLGCMEEKDINILNNNKKITEIVHYIKLILCISIYIITTYILVVSNIASCIKTETIHVNDSLEVVEAKIINYEKKVNLDRFEPKYKIKLNDAYNIYLSRLIDGFEDDVNKQKYVYILNNIFSNLQQLDKNESTNVSNVLNINVQYFNAMLHLYNVNSGTNYDKEYKSYLKYIYENMDKLYNLNDYKLKKQVVNRCIMIVDKLNIIDNEVVNIYKEKINELTTI